MEEGREREGGSEREGERETYQYAVVILQGLSSVVVVDRFQMKARLINTTTARRRAADLKLRPAATH